MFVISYVTVFASHPYLNLKRVVIERSFGHSLEELTSLSHLTREQLLYHDRETLLKLKDYAFDVHRCKSKASISHMFTTELKFASEFLLKWFTKKHMKFELTNEENQNYKRANQLNIEKDKCHICEFPLDLKIKGINANETEMTYSDFIIISFHMLLHNIYPDDVLKK